MNDQLDTSGAQLAGRRIGFIGLGLMGTPIATNLARAGADLEVWNRTASKADALAADVNCTVAANPVALARRSDVVITMVADGDVLERVLLADDRFSEALGRGGLVIDMSTIGPLAAQSTGERLATHGIRFVEAPVSGSTAAATAASLAILVGGTAIDFETALPILSVLGEKVIHFGRLGDAALIKLAINNLIYGINECLSESLILAERAGLDREAAYDAFLNSAAAAPVMGYRKEAFLHPDDATTSFTVRLGEKDLRLTLELAERVGAPMPQASLNREVSQSAIAAGYGESDVALVAEYLRNSTADRGASA